jgi:hypothetical protein
MAAPLLKGNETDVVKAHQELSMAQVVAIHRESWSLGIVSDEHE